MSELGGAAFRATKFRTVAEAADAEGDNGGETMTM